MSNLLVILLTLQVKSVYCKDWNCSKWFYLMFLHLFKFAFLYLRLNHAVWIWYNLCDFIFLLVCNHVYINLLTNAVARWANTWNHHRIKNTNNDIYYESYKVILIWLSFLRPQPDSCHWRAACSVVPHHSTCAWTSRPDGSEWETHRWGCVCESTDVTYNWIPNFKDFH